MPVSLKIAYRILAVATLGAGLMLSACAISATRHPVVVSDVGTPSRSSALEASLTRPGIVTFRRVLFADWMGGRGAFIDRADPLTVAVPKGHEQARIYAYVIDHPRHGRYLIDAGASAGLERRLGFLMRRAVSDLSITIHQTTAQWLDGETPPRAVFLTHLHFDHIGGLIDLDLATTVYLGPGEAQDRHWSNVLLGRPADAILEGYGPLREWAFQPDPDDAFEGVIDVFGDGSVWALHTPGHSPGSTSYLVNAVDGPKLVIGDAASTRLGWELGLPQPLPQNRKARARTSYDRLFRFARTHPPVEVFLGHQPRAGQAESTTQ